MFNDVNVRGRRKERVNGRVLVFTTSLTVEFLETNLRYSYPLWPVLNQEGPYALRGLTFTVELRGFLTFDENSQVKIFELGPYTRGEYDPQKFAYVKPSDPFVSRIVGSSPRDGYDDAYQACYVYYSAAGGYTRDVRFVSDNGPLSYAQWSAKFPDGEEWLGFTGYPGVSVSNY